MWNDKETDLDLLGNKRIAQTIISIMEEQELRPLTIGVYGHWGIGKSSVLNLIDRELADKEDTLVINFNSWLFQGYEDTKSALMETVVVEIMRLQPTDVKLLKLGKSLLKRINWLKVAKTTGSLALSAFSGLSATALFGLPAMYSQLKGIFTSKEEQPGVTVNVEKEDPESYLKDAEETVPGQIHAFRKELSQLIKSSKVSRIVILVDELDRCLPTAVIDILEAIRLFLFVEGTVFVLAADEQMIEYAVRKHFPDLPSNQSEYIKHYLEKLVQVPIRIPSLNQLQTKNYVRFLLLQNQLKNDKVKLKGLVDAFEQSKANPYENKDFTYEFISKQLRQEDKELKTAMVVAEQLGALLADELRGNPRNIKRYLNTIFFRLRVAHIYKITDKVHLDVLAKLMLLERFHPNEFEVLIASVNSSSDGKSEQVGDWEMPRNEGNKGSKQAKANLPVDPLAEWGKLNPPLKDLDLRPYIYVSSEKAMFFESSDEIPAILKPLYQALASGNKLAIAGLEGDIKALSFEQAKLLFDHLVLSAEGISDWTKVPAPINGILKLMNHFTALEKELIRIIDGLQEQKLKVWMVSNLAGFKSGDGLIAKTALFSKINSSAQVPLNVKRLTQTLTNQN